MKRSMLARLAGASTMLLAASSPALAHHVMDGETPRTFVEGLLSGFGHPVIEPLHLAAIVLAGAVAARLAGGIGLVVAFAIGSFFGTLAGFAEALVIDEAMVLATIAVLLLLMPFRFRQIGSLMAASFLGIGTIHGVAFAESIVGAEAGVLGAYLLGLALMEILIAGGVWAVVRRLSARRGRAA